MLRQAGKWKWFQVIRKSAGHFPGHENVSGTVPRSKESQRDSSPFKRKSAGHFPGQEKVSGALPSRELGPFFFQREPGIDNFCHREPGSDDFSDWEPGIYTKMGHREPGMSEKSQRVAGNESLRIFQCQRGAGMPYNSAGMSGEQFLMGGDPGGEELAGH